MNEARFAHYKTGIKMLDDEHWHLLMLMDDIHQLCRERFPNVSGLTLAMEYLHGELRDHIAHEEAYMDDHAFKWVSAHKAEHITLNSKMTELTASIKPGSRLVDFVFGDLEDLFLNHIDYFDRQINQ
jgi:hemerythrin-like metal-binding protein